MPKAAAATGWIGAPPECADGFAFAHGEFFAQASGQNQHRRATQAELKTHFTEGNERDHPAHWFEAQLIHYGLKASKTKAVARSRLLDAVNSGELKVPANLTALESRLKKTWTKKDKEAKSKSQGKGKGKAATGSVKDSASTASSSKQPAAKGGAKKETAAKTATPAKGKAASSSAKSVVKGSAKKEPATKTTTPARTAGVKRKAEADVENEASTKRTSAKKPTPKKINATGTAKRATGAAAASSSSPANVTKSKASARRGGGASSGPSRSLLTTDAGPGFVPRTKQTARRSGAFMARGRIPYAQSIEDYYHYDPMDLDEDDSQPDISNSERDDGDSEDDDSDCGFIEVLPGRYSITCPYVSSEWPDYGSSFLLKLALDESSVWGTFDLGVISGVMRFDEIPQGRSHECIPFTWRGRENEGMIMYGDDNEGWMKFLGDGNVEGYFDYQGIEFEGIRRPGPLQTNAAALRDEWDGYSEEQYEFENRSRWG